MSAIAPTHDEQLMARSGKTFYRAAGLLPTRIRRDVISLYAFCRAVDDLADDPAQPLAEREASLCAVITAFEAQNEPRLRQLGWHFGTRGRMPRAAALLVRAALGDLRQQQPASAQEVLDYAFGVAGTVGILMAEVLEAQPEGYSAAIALGMAMQLSNICRDVAEDLRAGRVYLPGDLAAEATIRQALFSDDAEAAQQVRRATLQLLALADQIYNAAYDGMWSLPWRVRWSILAAAMCYREIGVAVGRDVPLSWRRRTVIGTGRKLQLIALAGLRLLQPRFWRARRNLTWVRHLSGQALLQAHRLGIAA